MLVFFFVWIQIGLSADSSGVTEPRAHAASPTSTTAASSPSVALEPAWPAAGPLDTATADQASASSAGAPSRKRGCSSGGGGGVEIGGGARDTHYWERRRKNNEAAKRSRDARRAKEEEVRLATCSNRLLLTCRAVRRRSEAADWITY